MHNWARESQAIAKTDVYRDQNQGVQAGHLLSQPYETRGEDDVEKQIAKAGFRLATLIRLAFQ